MGLPLRVLVIEDSDDATMVLRELRRAGYDVDFERVDSSDALKPLVVSQAWDLVLKVVLVTDAPRVASVVEKFREKYGAGDVRKYYSKFDVAVVAHMR